MMRDIKEKITVEDVLNETEEIKPKERFRYDFIPLKACPRCGNEIGNKKIKRKDRKDKSAHTEIHCSNCGLVIIGETETSATKEWNRTKESRVEYAIRLLVEQGKVYIGERTKEEWKDSNLPGYLSKKTKKKIILYPPRTFDGGIIAEAVKTSNDNSVNVHIEGSEETEEKSLKTIFKDSTDYKTAVSTTTRKKKKITKTPTQKKRSPAPSKKRSPYKKDYPSIMKRENIKKR